jgi:CelD/BcsL family acetyltransferase involved in cellulose biosynthesis
MTPPTIELEPACPGAPDLTAPDVPSGPPKRRLRVERRPFDAIDRTTWNRLARSNPWATPFSSWAFQRAWWDAYGGGVHDQTLVVLDDSAGTGSSPVAIVPLMHRHEVEPDDEATHTTMRHRDGPPLTPVAPHAKAVFFGASYHADYATLLADPADMADVAEALVDHLADGGDPDHPSPWDVVDLRRLRCGDPAGNELVAAFERRAQREGWTVTVDREDVCPVVTLPAGVDFDGYLATLGKKERHEIRRKLRRAEAQGEVRLIDSAEPLADLDAFIDLHQRRWGAAGLFPPTVGGRASRTFVRRLFELADEACRVGLAFLSVGPRRIGAGIHFLTDDRYLYYNAGVDPEARELSPGVLMVARYVERALADGCRQIDFLRGDEPYKYEWGAVDEPIQRILVLRTTEQPR